MGTKFLPLFRCITSRWLVLFAVALAMGVMPTSAFAQGAPAQNCIQNEWNISQGSSSTCTSGSCSLNCTANDVSIAQVVNIRDLNGNQLVNCTENDQFNFIADFKVLTTSKSTRSNIGLYIAETGTTVNDALSVNNTCADNIIPPPPGFVNRNTTGKKPYMGLPATFQCAGAATGVKCGTDWYDELDQATTTPADSCGDSSSTDDGGGVAGQQIITLEIDGFTCPNPATGNLPTCTVNGVTGTCAVLPNCTSWQVPGKTDICVGTPGAQSFPLNNGVPEAVPGDKSKCNCEVITLPILVQTPVINVLKGCTSVDSPAPTTAVAGVPSGTNLNCSSGTEGADEVTYTVEVDNQSNTGYITLANLTDSAYGNIAGSCPSATCTADSTTCVATGQQIADKGSYSCTFTAHKSGDPTAATVTNHATASGGTQFAGNWGPQNSDIVTVTPTEAPSAATVTKSLGTPNFTAACVTANFSVDVKNTSGTGATAGTGTNAVTYDETETLTALSDSVFGNIATPGTLGTGVLSTNCTVPQTITAGNDYTCQFSAQFCSTGTTLQTLEEFGTGVCSTGNTTTPGTCTNPGATTPVGGCTSNAACDLSCLGVTHTNSITATMNGDEGAGDLLTPTANLLTTNVCIIPFPKSQ